jgi:ubiquinone/menaquinone biosynthesis C-methylase UbiE
MLTNESRSPSEREIEENRRASRRYWDAHPISTDAVGLVPGSRESFEAIYERWQATFDEERARFLASVRGQRVLEVGCGISIDGRKIVEHGGDYYAIDHSLRSLGLARRNFDFGALPASKKKFVNADAARLPFADGHFDLGMSIGVLMCVPEMAKACRELVRVVRPGGSVRVMLYCSRSYHYALVAHVVSPAIWLMLRLRVLEGLLRVAPEKFRHLYAISREAGFSRARILAASADTSFAGQDNFIPVSGFFDVDDMRRLFPGLEDYRFFKNDLKYFPLPFLRRFVEPRWGFFLTMTARKPAGPSQG